MKKKFYVIKYSFCGYTHHYIIIAKSLERAIKKFYATFTNSYEIITIKCLGTEKEIMFQIQVAKAIFFIAYFQVAEDEFRYSKI